MTDLQKASLVRVILATRAGGWHRAMGNGERVTLASLHRRGLVTRRPWRGEEGQAAAYEYQAAPGVMTAAIENR